MHIVSLDENIDQSYDRILNAHEDQALLASFIAKRPSLEERLAAGKALRKKVPRTAHAIFHPAAARPDPVEILEQQNRLRVQKLVPVRYARMLASPFSFLRGSAAVMASDLSNTPVTGLRVAACGDMHVSNFGLFASAERNLVFAINDFDEIHPGPWEWDIKRLAASAAVATQFMGGDEIAAEEVARRIVQSYRWHIRRYAEMGYLQVWYHRIDERDILDATAPRQRQIVEQVMNKAREHGHIRALDQLTEVIEGEHRFVEDIPLIVRESRLETGTPVNEALDRSLQSYLESLPHDRRRLLSRYRIVDYARKVVGVGSVGMSCWVILLQGLDTSDPLFLQIKEAQPSVIAPYVDAALPFDNQGRRVVVGQRLTQGSPDIFLGWGESEGRHFFVRQLADMKGGLKLAEGGREQLDVFPEYCSLCGWALALAHAKSGDPAMIAGYCGSGPVLDEAVGRFALAYLRQTQQDYEALLAAKRSGRIAVAQGVS